MRLFPRKEKPPTEISNIVMLVHPLFSHIVRWRRHEMSSHRDTGGEIFFTVNRRNISFLLGLWGKQIKEAANDPHAILVFVKFTHVPPLEYKRLMQPIDEKVEKLIRFAQRRMGKRLFLVNDTIDPERLQKEIQKKGFVLSTKLRGKTFGEYYTDCVAAQTHQLRLALNKVLESKKKLDWRNPLSRRWAIEITNAVKREPSFSVLPPHYIHQHTTLGPPSSNHRKSARKLRRRRGK